MTLPQLQQQIGQIQHQADIQARGLNRLDFFAECPGHPLQIVAADEAQRVRLNLSRLFTRLHQLEARLPTPELLSARAYDRLIMLGMSIDAAEAGRLHAYRQAAHNQRFQHAA